jgi:hypothetical protein
MNFDTHIHIPELEKKVKEEPSIKRKLWLIETWVTDNIKYELSLFNNKSAYQTFVDRKGECRDRMVLRMHLAKQYLGLTPDCIMLVTSYKNGKLHWICYYRKYNYYFGTAIDQKEYFNPGLMIMKHESYSDFMKLTNL